MHPSVKLGNIYQVVSPRDGMYWIKRCTTQKYANTNLSIRFHHIGRKRGRQPWWNEPRRALTVPTEQSVERTCLKRKTSVREGSNGEVTDMLKASFYADVARIEG